MVILPKNNVIPFPQKFRESELSVRERDIFEAYFDDVTINGAFEFSSSWHRLWVDTDTKNPQNS